MRQVSGVPSCIMLHAVYPLNPVTGVWLGQADDSYQLQRQVPDDVQRIAQAWWIQVTSQRRIPAGPFNIEVPERLTDNLAWAAGDDDLTAVRTHVSLLRRHRWIAPATPLTRTYAQ
jgi:hypothetical protein